MNEWINEIFNGFVTQPYFSKKISFWKEQENHNNICYLYKVYADNNSRYYNLYEWIRLYNNSFCDTYMSVPHWSRPTINWPPVTQFNHFNYEITPSNLFSVPSTIDGLKHLQIYEVMRFTRA